MVKKIIVDEMRKVVNNSVFFYYSHGIANSDMVIYDNSIW